MAVTQPVGSIFCIVGIDTCLAYPVLRRHCGARLTAAGNTSARAGHYFHKLKLTGTVFHFFTQFTCIQQTMRYRHFHSTYTRNVHIGFFDAFQAAYFFKMQQMFRRLIAGDIIVCGSYCSFHYAAGVTENQCAAAAFTAQWIKFAIRQISKVNVQSAQHFCIFAGTQNNIIVFDIFVIMIFRYSTVYKFRSGNFEFFGNTRC